MCPQLMLPWQEGAGGKDHTRVRGPGNNKCHGVGDDNASLLLEDADCYCPGVRIQLTAGVLWEPKEAV